MKREKIREAAQSNPCVLVGTYRSANAEWIEERSFYNLPLKAGCDPSQFSRFTHVVLYCGDRAPIARKCEFARVVDSVWMDANGYGVPQERYRMFMIGNRLGIKFAPPKPTHFPPEVEGKRHYATVGEAILDLVGKENEVPNHVPLGHKPIVEARYAYVKEGCKLNVADLPPELAVATRRDSKTGKVANYSHVFKRLHRDRPSTTMVPGHNAFPIHPTLNRTLTPREAARIQTFPDSHVFFGTRQDQCIQVGNAVFAGREAGSVWPLADGVIQAENTSSDVVKIAFEFKRPNEGVHGILTAIGQSYAYLEKGYDAAIMAIPAKYSSHADPGGYVNRVLEAASPKYPISIYTYSTPDLSATRPFEDRLTCVRDISLPDCLKIGSGSVAAKKASVSTLWAHVREGMSHPDVFFRYCQSIKAVTSVGEDLSNVKLPAELVMTVKEIDPSADPYYYLSNTVGETIADKVQNSILYFNNLVG